MINSYTRNKIEEINEELPNFLEAKGFSLNKNFSCILGTHEDNTPSMAYDNNRNRVKCFSCGYSGDMFDLIKTINNINDFGEALRVACNTLGLNYDEQEARAKETYSIKQKGTRQQDNKTTPPKKQELASMEDFIKWNKNLVNTDYLNKRGISQETANKFLIGYNENFPTNENGIFTHWGVIVIPTDLKEGNYIARNTNTEASHNNRVRKRGESRLFNISVLETSETPIFITEGEIDALSIIEVGGEAIGLGGTSKVRSFINEVSNKKEKIKAPLIVALDNDESGRKASEELTKGLNDLGVKAYKVNPYGDYKDGNEILVKNKGELIANINRIIKDPEEGSIIQYEREFSSYNLLSEFVKKSKTGKDLPRIPTGFKHFDKLTDGGLPPGVYILGAIPSLGKTDLILNIADNISYMAYQEENKENGNPQIANTDVLYFSLEMAKEELLTRSLSRHTFTECIKKRIPTTNAKATHEIEKFSRYKYFDATEREILQGAINDYSKGCKHLYMFEGVGGFSAEDVANITKNHKAITKHNPFVIVDYLQILAPINDPEHPNRSLTDKQITDSSMLALERLARDLSITVFVISSFNRDGYKAGGDFSAFKDSGNIEYGADGVFTMIYTEALDENGKENKNFDLQTERAKTPRAVSLITHKFRKTGGAIFSERLNFLYNSKYHYFEEDLF